MQVSHFTVHLNSEESWHRDNDPLTIMMMMLTLKYSHLNSSLDSWTLKLSFSSHVFEHFCLIDCFPLWKMKDKFLPFHLNLFFMLLLLCCFSSAPLFTQLFPPFTKCKGRRRQLLIIFRTVNVSFTGGVPLNTYSILFESDRKKSHLAGWAAGPMLQTGLC